MSLRPTAKGASVAGTDHAGKQSLQQWLCGIVLLLLTTLLYSCAHACVACLVLPAAETDKSSPSPSHAMSRRVNRCCRSPTCRGVSAAGSRLPLADAAGNCLLSILQQLPGPAGSLRHTLQEGTRTPQCGRRQLGDCSRPSTAWSGCCSRLLCGSRLLQQQPCSIINAGRQLTLEGVDGFMPATEVCNVADGW